jgi:hypothetical protein
MWNPIELSVNLTWEAVELLMPETQLMVWSRYEKTSLLNLIDEPDSENHFQESNIKKGLGRIYIKNINKI